MFNDLFGSDVLVPSSPNISQRRTPLNVQNKDFLIRYFNLTGYFLLLRRRLGLTMLAGTNSPVPCSM